MNLRSVIALFMGLVIQFSQVQSCLAASVVISPAVKAHPSCCCDGIQSCPCVSDREHDPKPGPLIPATVDLKWLVSKAGETDKPMVPLRPRKATTVSAASRPEARGAYAGVPLSVAFCRFVI